MCARRACAASLQVVIAGIDRARLDRQQLRVRELRVRASITQRGPRRFKLATLDPTSVAKNAIRLPCSTPVISAPL